MTRRKPAPGKASPAKQAKRAHAKKPAPAKKAAPAIEVTRPSKRVIGIAPFVEELEVALGELRRLSTELVSTRRQIVEDQAVGLGLATSMRHQAEALRTELKTARADLEIAQANARRIESRLEAAAEAEARARESQREAEHAADRARDEILWLRREVDRRALPGSTPSRSGDD